MIRLLVCDDSDAFRFAVRFSLEGPAIAVVGEAADGREAVDLARALSPDVVLMDVRMPVLDGVEATREITTASPHVAVVALTGWDDRRVVSAMLEAGAAAHCVKGAALGELKRTIVAVAAERPEAAREESRRDALTGLPNRRAFEEKLDQLLADPAGDPFGLVLLDLDDFKRVNGTYGHAAGDDVLREVAGVATRTVRADEELYRLGGDELGVLVLGGSAEAERVAARLITSLGRQRRGRPLPSASAGVASFPVDGMTSDRLLATADFRLFAAKAEGGGRIVGVEHPNPSWSGTDAEDLRKLLELEHGQRGLIQAAYRETVGALASALEAKDLGTNAHSHRVQQYAMELAWAFEPRLVEEPSMEYGFLLHDVGKIGIPDRILNKPGALTPAERRVLETHPVLGEQMLGGIALLQGAGLRVVRHHHERWDGAGYPDQLRGCDIPLPARIFAAADALDAMTSDRPYRAALGWDEALAELRAEAGKQFDPTIVEVVGEREPRLRSIREQFAASEAD